MRYLSLAIVLGAFSLISASGVVAIKEGAGRIDVSIEGKPFTTFYCGPSTMKPHLAPLRTSTGKIVTRRWPVENIGGETTDHPHHEGLWFTHGSVNGFNFWEHDKAPEKRGRVVVEKVTLAKGGTESGVIKFEARWLTSQNKTLLRETRQTIFSADGQNRIIDMDIVVQALEEPVTFEDTKEGTFAIRLADQLTEKVGSGTMENASGARKMSGVWGKPSPWVDYSGAIDGEAAGVAIFDHPDNPKHPTTWHVRDYGLFAANPFGDRDFYADTTRNGSITIQPHKSLRFRYRVIIHPGDARGAHVPQLYQAWKAN